MKHSIGFFFLTIFLMVKMAGLHVLAHDGDQDHYAHCVVSDHIVKSQHTPEISPAGSEFEVLAIEPLPFRPVAKNYEFLTDGFLAAYQLFSRPPPSPV
ncbi:hypothetical protein K1F50_08980 [Muricauda oceani]|uniref:Uncharacterized protein n=1 Tax=Flagellimonas oceani TaxID=2698672 RepID=A0A6G7J7B4_9FLAO|nr:hypothetical protein [Allomuricauda oceani]MBW8242931.1 hypothetical protein [Allomuricauda oceani]QII46706.1 hypothetical protein GVT53_19140 [Allomuricauda oceani]